MVCFKKSVFLATSFPGSPSVGMGRREPWERGCVFGRGGGLGDYVHSPLQERKGNWVELIFAKTSGTVTRDREKKLTNS